MPYRLKVRRSMSSEVRRIVDRQLVLAIEELHDIGNPRSDNAIHEARRHVKKVRAILRLVQPALGDVYYAANRRMRTASRLLAPIADGQAVVDTMARLRKKYREDLSQRTLTSIRATLVERAARIDRKAELDRAPQKVVGLLRAERRRVKGWMLNARGFRAVAPGLEKSFRRARKAMTRAAIEPTADHYHVWRRRVKDLWLQMRLLEGRCGNKLAADQLRLEALDGHLGEHHNVALLETILTSEALVSRRQTARCLHVLRRYQSELRLYAKALGTRVHHETAGHFVRRIKRSWRSTKAAVDEARKRKAWPRAA